MLLIQRKPFSLTSKEKMKLKFIFQKIIGDKLNAMEIPLYQNSKHTTMDSGIFLPPILAASTAQKQCFIVRLNSENFSKFFLCLDILLLTYSHESTPSEVTNNADNFPNILEYS